MQISEDRHRNIVGGFAVYLILFLLLCIAALWAKYDHERDMRNAAMAKLPSIHIVRTKVVHSKFTEQVWTQIDWIPVEWHNKWHAEYPRRFM